MVINTETVGKAFGPLIRDYTFRDLGLSVLGCGTGIDDKDGLEYISEHDERDPHLRVFPMFGTMLIVDSEVARTIDYGYNYVGSLHWGLNITFHKPITKMSDHLETMMRLGGLYDHDESRGLLVQHIGDTYDSDGNLPSTNEFWDYLIYDGGQGDSKPPRDIVEMPNRPTDVEITETIPENQALIYHLSDDYHPQYIDQDYTAENGEPCPILYAISHAGAVMRHAINAFVPGESEHITRLKTRITSLVHPGTILKICLWKIKEDGLCFVLVDADVDGTGARPHLNWGIIEHC